MQTAGVTWGKTVLFNNISNKPTTEPTFYLDPSSLADLDERLLVHQRVLFHSTWGSPTVLTESNIGYDLSRHYHGTTNPSKPAAWTAQTQSNEIWYTLTKPVGLTAFQLFINNTCPGFSTAIAVYTGPCGALTLVAADESSNGGGNPRVSVTGRPCTSAEQFWVRVEGDQDALLGNFDLTLPPPGSNCFNANDITCWYTSNGSYNTSTLGWTMNNNGFGYDIDTPAVVPPTRNLSGQDYIFTFTPPVAGCFDLSCSSRPATPTRNFRLPRLPRNH